MTNIKKTLIALLFAASSACYAQSSANSHIKVDGNQFVTEAGKTIIFRGLNFSDPDKLEKDGKWNLAHFQEAKNWGANIVRLPVHPSAWRSRGPKNYVKLLDQAVEWSRSLGLYLVIDWHSIGNLRTGLYQHEMYNTTLKETYEFWYAIAKRYGNEPVVAMYELFNEPTTFNNQLGTISWAEWKGYMTDLIVMIRANNAKGIPLVAGFNWAYDLTPLITDDINLPGIAYVSHPYPQKRDQPWEPQWERDFGFVADKYPVILTEIGFALPEEKGVHIPVTGDEAYGNAIVNYTRQKGISWVVWAFDPDWSPMMFSDWNYTPTRQGAFFKKVLQGK